MGGVGEGNIGTALDYFIQLSQKHLRSRPLEANVNVW